MSYVRRPSKRSNGCPISFVHLLAHEGVEVTDSPSAVAEPAAGVLLGSPWALHDSVHRHERQHTDAAHGLTFPRIAWLLAGLADASRASIIVPFSRPDPRLPLDVALVRTLCSSTYIPTHFIASRLASL